MKIGTKSVIFGAHCFALHPWFVALAWWKLFGFPWDPRLWVAFFVHDLGYFGKPNMDGPEGETHVELGAKIMSFLFDWNDFHNWRILPDGTAIGPWGQFSLFHSRYYAKLNGKSVSKLCFADKLSFCLTPAWLYLPMVNWTGEIHEYLDRAKTADSDHWKAVTSGDQKLWHSQLVSYMKRWVNEHVTGKEDTWTNANRHGGVIP